MITTINNKHKKLNFSSEREQSQACLNSAEHEKNQGRKVLNVPNLRFKEFLGEWEKCTLEDVMNFSTTRVNSSELNEDNYVSTENMLQDYQGMVDAKSVPKDVNVISFSCGDILISNIRPYLKKVWKATYNGGCSSDVFVLKANDNIESDYLYYVIANDKFINFVMSGAKGVKMPRGDKNQMKTYSLSLPQIQEQKKIGKMLSLLDERIATQNKIIDKLQSLIKGISNRIFASIQGIEYRMGDIVTITNGNSNVQDAVTQSKDGLYPFFDRSEDIKYLPTFLFDKEAIIYPGEGTEFMPRYFKGKFALHQRCYAIFDFNEIINARFLYFYLKTRNSYFVKNAVGSTVPSLRLDTFQMLKVIIPPTKTQHSVSSCLSSMEQKCNVEKKILYKLLNQKQYLLRQMFI